MDTDTATRACSTSSQQFWLRSLLLGCMISAVVAVISIHQNLHFSPPLPSHPLRVSIPNITNVKRKPGNATTDSYSAAYVFLLAGCNPDQPVYRGFLFNILLAVDQLKRVFQSKADVIVMVHLNTNATRLPPEEEGWLEKVGAIVKYLDNSKKETSFSSWQMLKFRMLQFTQYQRLLFLDSDVLPICNLDYLFEMSLAGVLRENLVIAWTKEPANGGFFLMEPTEGAYEELLDVVKKQRESAKDLPLPHFDKERGWGHTIAHDDPWYTFQRRLSGRKWSFYAAYSDQGLLYHYVKYVKRSVSIVLGKSVQNWKPTDDGGVVLDETLQKPFDGATCRRQQRAGEKYLHHPATGNSLATLPPYGDFMHFYSVFKPWQNLDSARYSAKQESKTGAADALEYWFLLLSDLDGRLGMNLPLPQQGGETWKSYWSSLSRIGDNKQSRVPTLKELKRLGRSAVHY